MRLTVEAFWRSDWRECGTIEILDAQLGYRGPSIVEYDIDYFANFAAADYSANGEVGDARAMSVRFPVDLECRYLATWPPFLLDLMPQGTRDVSSRSTLGCMWMTVNPTSHSF